MVFKKTRKIFFFTEKIRKNGTEELMKKMWVEDEVIEIGDKKNSNLKKISSPKLWLNLLIN